MSGTDTDREQVARIRIAKYRARQDAAVARLREIDRGMTYHQALGNEPMHDVTDQRRNELENEIALYEELVRMWERDLA